MEATYTFIPLNSGERQYTVHLFITSNNGQDAEYEIEALTNTSGKDVSLKSLDAKDLELLEEELEKYVSNLAEEAYELKILKNMERIDED